MADKAKIVKLNTDNNQNLAANYNIQGRPCLIIFKDGSEQKRIAGFKGENVIISELENYV